MDPVFLRSVSRAGPFVHLTFLVLVVLNLVGGFEALGTLLAVGLMMLPAAAARFWTRQLEPMCLLAIGIGLFSNAVGLLISYHLSVASGPAIILTAGAVYGLSLAFGTHGLIVGRLVGRHRTA
jgi:zinc/manganese transport system permease protein